MKVSFSDVIPLPLKNYIQVSSWFYLVSLKYLGNRTYILKELSEKFLDFFEFTASKYLRNPNSNYLAPKST